MRNSELELRNYLLFGTQFLGNYNNYCADSGKNIPHLAFRNPHSKTSFRIWHSDFRTQKLVYCSHSTIIPFFSCAGNQYIAGIKRL